MRRFNLNILMTMGVLRLTFLSIKAHAVFSEGLQVSGFIADDGPKLTVEVIAANHHVYRAVPLLLVELDRVEAKRLTTLEVESLQLTPAFARAPDPGVALEANSVVPAKLATHQGHRLQVNEAPVSEQNHLDALGQSVRALVKHLSILAEGHRGTASF